MDMVTTKTKSELREELDSLVEQYNSTITSEDGSAKALRELDEKIKEKQNEYTYRAKCDCFAELLTKEDPMLEAIKLLTFETVRAKDVAPENDPKSEIKLKVVQNVDKPIDLAELHRTKHIGKDPNWVYMIEKFNMLMTARACKELNVDCKSINDSYNMRKISREIDLGKELTSNTQLLKVLQQIVDAMIGNQYKALSHDVRYLDRIYLKKGKNALSVIAAGHKNFRQYIAEICHRIVTNGVYDVEYKTIKPQKQ